MGIKSWVRTYFKRAEKEVSNKPIENEYEYYESLYEDDMSEPFITFYSRVKSGDIPWTVRSETSINVHMPNVIHDKEIYTFIVNEDTTVEMFRSRTDSYQGLWQKPEMFTYRERIVLSEYLKWYEYNKIEQEKEQRMQNERNKLAKALGLPIDNPAT